jgi:hypothetical protein
LDVWRHLDPDYQKKKAEMLKIEVENSKPLSDEHSDCSEPSDSFIKSSFVVFDETLSDCDERLKSPRAEEDDSDILDEHTNVLRKNLKIGNQRTVPSLSLL